MTEPTEIDAAAAVDDRDVVAAPKPRLPDVVARDRHRRHQDGRRADDDAGRADRPRQGRRRPRPQRRRAVRHPQRRDRTRRSPGLASTTACASSPSASAAPARSRPTWRPSRRSTSTRGAKFPLRERLVGGHLAARVRRPRCEGAGAGRGLAGRGAGQAELSWRWWSAPASAAASC